MRAFIILQIIVVLTAAALSAKAARLKDIANVRGVRTNQLVGYGIVIGLNGTGDSKAEFTSNSMSRMLDRLGMKLNDKEIASKNVAAVIVTADLPPFARAGNKLDVTISSIGDASSLKGGMLIQTPLRAADQQTYAVAQGSVLVGFSATGVHETVARMPNGAMIERDLGGDFATRNMFRLTLTNPDFTTAARVAKKINLELAGKYASALDAGSVDVIAPSVYEGRGVDLLSIIENLDVSPDARAKVVVNEKTGTVVIGNGVKISKVAISHGDIALKVGGDTPGKKTDGEKLIMIDESANVGDIVKAINRLGVGPRDLITILQSIKAAGALQADLEIL
jgi:flagellar P-ring protein FlgI